MDDGPDFLTPVRRMRSAVEFLPFASLVNLSEGFAGDLCGDPDDDDDAGGVMADDDDDVVVLELEARIGGDGIC